MKQREAFPDPEFEVLTVRPYTPPRRMTYAFTDNNNIFLSEDVWIGSTLQSRKSQFPWTNYEFTFSPKAQNNNKI